MKELKQSQEQGLFRIGIFDAGRSLVRIATLLTQPGFLSAFPRVRLVAAAGISGREAPAALPTSVAYYEDYLGLLAAHPDLDMLFDLSGDAAFFHRLSRAIPPNVSLVNRSSALFIWDLMVAEKERRECTVELTRATTLLSAIFDEVEDDILLFDREGRLEDMNRNAYVRRGVRKEDLIGRTCRELDTKEFCRDRENDDCPFRDTLALGKKSEKVHAMVNEDGRMHYARVYTYPIFDADKHLAHVLEMRRDITQRTGLELRVQQSEKMAAIGELATYIAHEIRNPLFAIGGFANSLLRMPSLDEAAREKAKIILNEALRLDKILKSTLDFARPAIAAESRADVNRVVAETMDFLRLGFEGKQVEAHVELAATNAMVQGDPDLLKQCLINMVKNSMEAMPGGGRLSVRTGIRGVQVFLEVEDSGLGIPTALRTKVFSPFFSTKETGSGLGLAMIKKIVEEMGGEVELQSQEGKGTRIKLLLKPVLAIQEKDENFPPQV